LASLLLSVRSPARLARTAAPAPFSPAKPSLAAASSVVHAPASLFSTTRASCAPPPSTNLRQPSKSSSTRHIPSLINQSSPPPSLPHRLKLLSHLRHVSAYLLPPLHPSPRSATAAPPRICRRSPPPLDVRLCCAPGVVPRAACFCWLALACPKSLAWRLAYLRALRDGWKSSRRCCVVQASVWSRAKPPVSAPIVQPGVPCSLSSYFLSSVAV
jgi:hypothetical protein